MTFYWLPGDIPSWLTSLTRSVSEGFGGLGTGAPEVAVVGRLDRQHCMRDSRGAWHVGAQLWPPLAAGVGGFVFGLIWLQVFAA